VGECEEGRQREREREMLFFPQEFTRPWACCFVYAKLTRLKQRERAEIRTLRKAKIIFKF
jgi:hypothetical protein